MKKEKALLCLCISLAMLLLLLPGCEKKGDEPTDGVVVSEEPAVEEVVSNEPEIEDVVSEEPADDTGGSIDNEPADDVVFFHSDGIDENGFWEGIRALDYVEMFNYRALSIPNDIHAITEETIQTNVEYLLADYPSIQHITDRAIIDGDTVNIDFVGSVDGVEFENGSTGGTGMDVTIGVTEFIDDFLQQLIGHMPGETINVEVTFPDVYQEPSLEGKDALFITDINYIVEESEAELNDEFVSENLSMYYDWMTVGEMLEGIRSILQQNAIEQYVFNYLVTEVVVQLIPDQLILFQQNAMLKTYREYAEYYGLELEDLISYEGYSDIEELIEANNDGIMQNATYCLVSQAVAEDSGISVSEEDVASYFSENVGTGDYSPYEEQYGLPYLKQVSLYQKILDYIVENAVLE